MGAIDFLSIPLRILGWALILSFSAHCFAEIHGSVSVVSNNIGRGYSKSKDQFAYQANFDYEHDSGLFAGTSVSTVNFGDAAFKNSARLEIVPYLGWGFALDENWRLEGQYSRYFYDDDIFGANADYNEFFLFAHFRDLFSFAASFSEDYYNREHAAGFFEITGRYPITDFLEFSAGTGYSLTRKVLDSDYLYWNTGFTAFYKMISLDLRYADAAFMNTKHTHPEEQQLELYPTALPPTLLFSITLGF